MTRSLTANGETLNVSASRSILKQNSQYRKLHSSETTASKAGIPPINLVSGAFLNTIVYKIWQIRPDTVMVGNIHRFSNDQDKESINPMPPADPVEPPECERSEKK